MSALNVFLYVCTWQLCRRRRKVESTPRARTTRPEPETIDVSSSDHVMVDSPKPDPGAPSSIAFWQRVEHDVTHGPAVVEQGFSSENRFDILILWMFLFFHVGLDFVGFVKHIDYMYNYTNLYIIDIITNIITNNIIIIIIIYYYYHCY